MTEECRLEPQDVISRNGPKKRVSSDRTVLGEEIESSPAFVRECRVADVESVKNRVVGNTSLYWSVARWSAGSTFGCSEYLRKTRNDNHSIAKFVAEKVETDSACYVCDPDGASVHPRGNSPGEEE